MAKLMTKTLFTVGLLAILLAVPAFGASVNKSIKIDVGGTSSGESSVNGSITVGDDAIVDGRLKTVNGSIRIESGAKVETATTVNGGVRVGEGVLATGLKTVNGSIKVGETSSIDGFVKAVNGRINLEKAVSVSGDVSNVNGHIELSGAEVGGNIATVTGDVSLVDGAILKGDLVVEKPNNWGFGNRQRKKPRIVIGPGARVDGTIILEHEVALFVSETASIGGIKGVMDMDQAVRFSGERP